MDVGELSIDSLGYELVNKRYRNGVLAHCRIALQREFGLKLDEHIRTLYVREWQQIEKSSLEARAKGVEREYLDSLDLLSVNHFRVLFEKHFQLLVPESSLPDGEAAKLTRQKLLGWLTEVSEVRNPNAHPAEDDLSIMDALRVADTVGRVLRVLQLASCLESVEPLQRELIRRAASIEGQLPTVSTLVSTLPPQEVMYDRFVGRNDELERLWGWFADDASFRWVLVGEGGKGKSAIAHQFALGVQRANPQSLAAVLWLSAKQRRFEESQTVAIGNPDFVDLESALDRLLLDFGDTGNLGKTVDAKRQAVLALLTDFPCLIVVDDLDSIEEANEDVVEFFTYEAPRTRSKVLVTSRRMYPGMSRTSTRVAGLPRHDALEYVKGMTSRLGIGDPEAVFAKFATIFEATEGSPLYIEDLLRLCRSLSVREAVERWQMNRGDAARRYALQRERDLLSTNSRRCLEAVCWAKAPLSLAQLETILGIGEDEALSSIQDLESRFLVPVPDVVEGVPVYRAHRNLEVIVRQDLRADPSTMSLRNAVDGLLGASRVRSSRDVVDVERQVHVRLKSGRLNEALVIVERSLAENPNSADLLAVRAVALMQQSPPRVTDAKQDWSRAVALGLRRRDAFLEWAALEDRRGDLRSAVASLGVGLERNPRDPRLLHQSGYANSRLGQSLLRGIDTLSGYALLDEADRQLRDALRLFRGSSATDYVLGRVYRALVVNAQHMEPSQRDRSVVYWTLQWLDECPTSPDARAEAERQSKRHQEVKRALDALARPQGS